MASSWERLYSSTLGSSSVSIDTGVAGIAAKDFLRIIVETSQYTNNGLSFRFNGDTGNSYIIRRSSDGGTDSTTGAYNHWYNGSGAGVKNRYATFNIINIANKEKLIIQEQIMATAGASNAPTRIETVGKWINTSAQITDVHLAADEFAGGSYTFGVGTTMTVWGTDDDVLSYTYPNLSNGTLFEESDTGKHYMFDGTSTWNEIT